MEREVHLLCAYKCMLIDLKTDTHKYKEKEFPYSPHSSNTHNRLTSPGPSQDTRSHSFVGVLYRWQEPNCLNYHC